MTNVDITDSDSYKFNKDDNNEIGEIYEEKGYSKIPLDQINLNTEPIMITNDFGGTLFDTNLKSYIKVILGFLIFIIILFIISILSGHFHYEKIEDYGQKDQNLDNLQNNINNNISRQIEIQSEPKKNITNQTLINDNLKEEKNIDLPNISENSGKNNTQNSSITENIITNNNNGNN